MGIGRWRGAFQVGERWGDGGDPRRDARWPAIEQLVSHQARIPVAALRVQDLELGTTARWTVPVSGHRHRATPSDHVPAEPDPAQLRQLQSQPARLPERSAEIGTHGAWLHQQEQRAGPPGQRRQPGRAIAHSRPCERRGPSIRKIHDQQVDRPGSEQRRGQRQPLLEIDRGEHDEPLQADATGDRLHRIEGTGEIQPGDDRSGCLRLGNHPQRHRGLARRGTPTERHGGRTRKPARPEQGIQRGEPGRDDPAIGLLGPTPGPDAHRRDRHGGRHHRLVRRGLGRHRCSSEGAFDRQTHLSAPSEGCRSPACLEPRERFGYVG